MWKTKQNNDKLTFEGLKDHEGNEILTETGENIEAYTTWGNEKTNWNIKS